MPLAILWGARVPGGRVVDDLAHSDLLTAGLIWDIPGPRTGVARAALGGWQLNWLVSARSGQPFTPDLGGDRANIGARSGWNYTRPHLVGNPELSNPDVNRWFNADAFAIQLFEYGNAGRNILRAPRLYQCGLFVVQEDSVG